VYIAELNVLLHLMDDIANKIEKIQTVYEIMVSSIVVVEIRLQVRFHNVNVEHINERKLRIHMRCTQRIA
jgi:hypothetical protein